jgi:hypothetical protein
MVSPALRNSLLAVALVVAQVGVHAHALSHFEEALYGDVHPDHSAEVCVAFAGASGGAAVSADSPLVPGRAPCALAGRRPADPLLSPLALTRFSSRAPPAPAGVRR